MLSPEATLIVLRESLEGFLIVSILTGLVVKFGKPESKRYLLAGAISAVAATALLGVLTDATARDFLDASGSEALFAAIAALTAALILTYMIVWMYKHTITLVAEMRSKAKNTVQVGKPIMLFLLAFVAVGREGIETVLFFATLAPTSTAMTLALSTLVGFAASALLAYLVFNGIVRLNLSKFFAASGLLLVLFASGLFAAGVGDLSAAHVLPSFDPAWSTKAALDEDGTVGGILHAVVGYLDSPSWLQVIAYVGYAVGVGAWYLRGIRLHAKGLAQHAHVDAIERRLRSE